MLGGIQAGSVGNAALWEYFRLRKEDIEKIETATIIVNFITLTFCMSYDFRETTDTIIECLQTAVDTGCDAIGNKMKKLYREGGDAICRKE